MMMMRRTMRIPFRMTAMQHRFPGRISRSTVHNGSTCSNGRTIAMRLRPDQRMQIVRMGRLIQKGRKLTRKQEEQVLEMVALVQRLGYRIP